MHRVFDSYRPAHGEPLGDQNGALVSMANGSRGLRPL